jgi:hypothetical protein
VDAVLCPRLYRPPNDVAIERDKFDRSQSIEQRGYFAWLHGRRNLLEQCCGKLRQDLSGEYYIARQGSANQVLRNLPLPRVA